MPKFDEIKATSYYSSLTKKEQETLLDTFMKWPSEQQDQFTSSITQMEEGELIDSANDLEASINSLKESEAEARHDEESTEKKEEMKELETMLNTL